MGWIGVDLDGTLAVLDENGSSNGEIGKPITAMMDRVKVFINKGEEVRIFTARAGDSSEVKKVKAWLKENGLEGLKVTNVKDQGMTMLFDDKWLHQSNLALIENITNKINWLISVNARFFISHYLKPSGLKGIPGKYAQAVIAPWLYQSVIQKYIWLMVITYMTTFK